jgi:hypothetical protein
MEKWIVECNIGGGKWVELAYEDSKAAAERVAEFMRLAEPAPNSVRVIFREVASGPLVSLKGEFL